MTSLTRSFPLLINLYQQLARQTSALVHGRTVQPAAALPITPVAGSSASSLHLLITPPLGPNAVTQMQVIGTLDRHSYQAFIASAAALYRQGQTKLLVDLGQTTQIELSGLFALHSIARLYAGGSLLDPESGWAGLRAAAEEATPALGERVKLLAPSPAAVAALEQASFCRFFTCYPDWETATMAFAVAPSMAE